MIRHWADHITTETGDEVRVELHDSSFGGTATKLQGTGSGWFSHTPQKLDPREPLKNPIIKTEVKASVWVTDATLITDIFTAQEGRFTLIYDKNSVQEFEGYVLPDLCTKTQLESSLWRLDIVAKDLSILEGGTYTLQTGRETPIEIIAGILSDKFSLNIVTHTSWIVDGTTTANDFMRQVYKDTFALRTYARTGDESDEAITLIQALTFVLQSCGAILRQAEGKFYIQQLTAFDDPTSVLESNYDSAGAFVSASNVDLTTTAKIVISPENGNPGVKSARLKYDHRTAVSGITLPSDIEMVDAGTESFTQLFIGDGTQTISISFDVYAETDIDQTSMDARVRILIDTYYLQDDGSWDTSTNSYYEVSLTKGKPLVGGGNVWRGSLNLLTDPIPDAADGTLTLQFAGATGNSDFADETLYTALSFKINNEIASENSTSIDYLLTQSGTQSVRVDYGTIIFGDGPTGYSRGAITTDSAGNTLTSDDWARRGEGSFVNHAQIVLREVLDVQRTFRNRFSATVKSTLSYIDIVSRDSKYFYNLGGAYDGYTGIMSPELLEINIVTGSDTFEDLPKFGNEGSSGTSGTASGGGGGLDPGTGDDRYYRQTELLSETASGDLPTLRTNIGLGSAQAVTFGSATLSNLTSGRVAYAGASGLLQDSANFTFDGTNVDLPSATFGSAHALTGSLGDARYGQLGAPNMWLASNEYNFGSGRTVHITTPSGHAGFIFNLGETDNYSRFNVLNYSNATVADRFFELRYNIDGVNSGLRIYKGGDVSFQNELLSGTTTVIDSSRNAFFAEGTFSGDVTIDKNLFIAGGLFAKEFVVDVTRNQSSVRMSPTAGGKIAEITDATVGAEKVKFEDEDGNAITPFSDNDLFQIQVATGASSGTIVKSIKRKVVADGQTGNVVSLTTTGVTSGTDVGTIEVGDDATHAGNTTNASRDHYIDFITAGVTIPYIGVKDEVDDFGGGFEAVRFGGVNSFDAAITGDAGIMGATKTDGAVFWITEDEAKIGSFEIKGDQMTFEGTSGATVMGDTSGTGFYGFGVTATGDFTGSDNFVRIFINDDATSYGFQALDSNGDTVARFGSSNFLKGLDITGDITAIDGGRVIGRNSSDDLVFSLSPSGVTFWNSSGAQVFSANSDANEVRIAQRLRLDLDVASSASSGGASALPANPETYISVDVNDGGTVKTLWIPAYDSAGSPPSAPGSVSLCQAASALRVSWGSVGAATGYIVERATSGTGPWSQVADTASTSYDDPFPPFNSSVTYHYRVFAYNANGSSGASSTVSDSYDGATAC